MQKIDDSLLYISKITAIISAGTVFIVLLVTTADVVLLKLFSTPIPGSSELITLFMPFIVFGYLLEVQLTEAHISVDVLTNQITNTTIKKAITVFVNLLVFCIIVMITWYIVPQALKSAQTKEYLSGLIPYPIYYAKLFTAAVFCFVSFQSLVKVIKSIFSK
ncbi:MAG: TRAP transporter small permease subunit [Dethiobacteria bacterium]